MLQSHRSGLIAGLAVVSLLTAALAVLAVNAVSAQDTSPSTGSTERSDEGAERAPERRVITVKGQEMSATTTVGGTVVPYREVTFSAEVPGRVEFIAGQEGARVDRGKLVVALDQEELRAQRRSVLSEIQRAHYQLQNAQVQFDRQLRAPSTESVQQLPGMGVPSLFDKMFTRQAGDMLGFGDPAAERGAAVHASRMEMSKARTQLDQAYSKLREIDAKFRDSSSVAPYDGIIFEKFVEEGDSVQPGQPLVRFADGRWLQIQADVASRIARNLREGMNAQARLDDADKTRIPIRVANIFPMADPERHTIRVKFDLPTGAPVSSGMYAEVILPDKGATRRDVVVIPQNAVIYRGGLPMARVLVDDEETELRLLRLGETRGDGEIEVLTGLRPGEQLIVNGG